MSISPKKSHSSVRGDVAYLKMTEAANECLEDILDSKHTFMLGIWIFGAVVDMLLMVNNGSNMNISERLV